MQEQQKAAIREANQKARRHPSPPLPTTTAKPLTERFAPLTNLFPPLCPQRLREIRDTPHVGLLLSEDGKTLRCTREHKGDPTFFRAQHQASHDKTSGFKGERTIIVNKARVVATAYHVVQYYRHNRIKSS